jgi:hypothetical protein
MKRLVLALTMLVGAVLILAAGASATMEGHEVTVTNPYAACVLTPDIFGGVNYLNTEPEPWVARNPAAGDNLIGGFQQDRWDDGGAKGLVAGWSFNDGYTWGDTALPFSKCALPYYGGLACPVTPGVASPVPCSLPYDRASDPWVSVGPDGKAYQVSISFNANDNNNAVGATVSTDGGATWHNTAEIIHDLDGDPTFPFNDKESVTADPVLPNTAYVVWDRLVAVNCGVAKASLDAPSADSRHWAAQNRGSRSADSGSLDCYEGPTFFSQTTDGGQTWSTPRPIVSNSPDEQTIGNEIVVDPRTGRLYDFYLYFPNREPFTPELRMVFSDDKGATWSPQQFINTDQTVGIHDPQTFNFARTGDIIPQATIDPKTGQLYLAWQDGRYNANGQDDVLFSTSVGGGLTGTWTVPQRVNLPSDRAGFTPGITVNALDQLGVDYYSMRHPDLGPDVWPIDRYLRISSGPAIVSQPQPGQTPVASIDFNTPTHVTGPFNMLMAPFAGGFFTGDYEALTVDRDGRSFHTYYAQTNCDTTNCPAEGTPAPATGTAPNGPSTSSPPDPFDVYTNSYFKNGQ